MTSEEEFQAFVSQNKDLIERMIALQKGAAGEFIGAERAIAREAYGHARGFADQGRARADDMFSAAMATFTDPEVQRHFMNMGMEFFMGMAAMMQRAPMPDFVRTGFNNAESGIRDAACRANQDCGARRAAPQKVSIVNDAEPRKDIPDDVFKSPGE